MADVHTADDLLAEDLLLGLNEAQRRAVTTSGNPLAILAGAGSGKTRVLTHRIAWRAQQGSLDPTKTLAVTFTRKAAGELRIRLRRLGLRDDLAAGTFHGLAYAQLRQRWSDRGVDAPGVLDRKWSVVRDVVPARMRAESDTIRDVIAEIEWAKARAITPERYPAEAERAERRPPRPSVEIAEIFEAYEALKKKRRMVDFDDLLSLLTKALRADADFAAAQRWRFRHLFVDEFQDVNTVQWNLLKAWLGDRLDLCVVGDPNQAIYAWNGADARYLRDFTRWFPGGDVTRLTDNYRCSPQVLTLANALLARDKRAGPPLVAHAPDGPVPTIRAHADERAEAKAVAKRILDRRRPGRPWRDQAVLVRTNAQTGLLEEALRAAGIPHRTKAGSGLLDRPEVKAALARLNRWTGPLGVFVADLDLVAGGSEDPDDPTAFAPEADSAAANLGALAELAREYLSIDPAGTGQGFLSWLAASVRDEDAAGKDAVEIVTFHAAKGLEWPVVHLAGVEQGLVPIGHAKGAIAVAEERRLLYVALTRAERELHITWAESRSFKNRPSPRQPSPWLHDLDAAIAGVLDGDRPADGRARVASLLSGLAGSKPVKGSGKGTGPKPGTDLSPADQALYDALKTWRSNAAKAANVPAYVVFADAVLDAVARARPANRAQLLAISGIGPTKAERYGDTVLGLVAAQPSG